MDQKPVQVECTITNKEGERTITHEPIPRKSLQEHISNIDDPSGGCYFILHPRVTLGLEIHFTAIGIPDDDKAPVRRKMVELARDLITEVHMLSYPGEATLCHIMANVIEGRDIYKDGVGEFFELYGRFEQKYGTTGKETETKMKELIDGNMEDMKDYQGNRGETWYAPYPYVVRNVLAHQGTNPNQLDVEGNDLRKSIDLLREWI